MKKNLQLHPFSPALYLHDRSDRFTQPVRPVATTLVPLPVRLALRTGQTGLCKTEGLHTLPSSVQPDVSLA